MKPIIEDSLYCATMALIGLTFPISLPYIFVSELLTEEEYSVFYPPWKTRATKVSICEQKRDAVRQTYAYKYASEERKAQMIAGITA